MSAPVPHDPRDGAPAPLVADEAEVVRRLRHFGQAMLDAWASGDQRAYGDAKACREEFLT